MTVAALVRASPSVPCRPIPRHLLDAAGWADLVGALKSETATALLALWADPGHVHALLQSGVDLLLASVPVQDGHYPALSPIRPAAAWFERMIQDLWGHVAVGGVSLSPWIDHGRWNVVAPLAPRPRPRAEAGEAPTFLAAEGTDLQQIPVGPVHAGIIEPGHFRFSTDGERVVRLEVRLGYTHKGTLALARGKTPRAAARFAARISGDSTVAHAVAFARAAEAATDTPAPPRADTLRGIMAELERIANHLGDLGAIAGDASFALFPARFGALRETVLRASAEAFGHRLMMDLVIPGGVAGDLAPGGAAAIERGLGEIEAELPRLAAIYDDAASLVDRMTGTGPIPSALADRFAAGGYVGRASGRAVDLRAWPGYPPYDSTAISPMTHHAGDVDARVRVRLAEIGQSIALARGFLAGLPAGAIAVQLPMAGGEGIGWAESFRGDTWHWMRLEGGLISACFARDPSWLHWPLLEAAMDASTILADFPLVNKSVNGSYSGVDL